MVRPAARGAAACLGLALLSLAACGRKAPLRLPDSRPAEKGPAVHARVREGRVTLDFRVPARRIFPEREEPWVLARVLRQVPPSGAAVEAGALLQTEGFEFDAPLSWSEQESLPTGSFVYRIEFRDAQGRRRSVSDPLPVAWAHVPEAPSGLTAEGSAGAIVLLWTPPAGVPAGTRYRIYRRGGARQTWEPVSPETAAESHATDSRIDPGVEYCYAVRGVLNEKNLEVEGPASAEGCARAAGGVPPPARPPAAAPGGSGFTP